MAARDLYPVQGPASMNWSASTWALTDGGTADEAKPDAGDTVYFSANSGDVTLDEDSAALAYFDAYHQPGVLTLNAGTTLVVSGSCLLGGTIVGTGTINASDGMFWQAAAVADTVTLLLTASDSRDIYWTATGGSVNINATGTYTLGTACNSYALTVTAGTLAGNSKTWTVGAGGFTFTDGTISGTLTVDLSAAAGAYDQTDGEIAAAAVLNVTTGTGATTFAALTKTGTLNIALAGISDIGWDSSASPIDTLTVNGAATFTDNVYPKTLAGSGSLAIGANELYFRYPASNFWTFSGSVTGTGKVIVLFAANISNTEAITVGSTGLLEFTCFPDRTLTLPGKLTTAGGCSIKGTSEGVKTTLVCNGGSSFGGAVTLGKAGGAECGALVLGPNRVYAFASTVARTGTSTGTANAFNFGGRVELSGDVTLAGIIPNFGSAYIVGAKTLPTLNGASAGTVANVAAVIARMTITNLAGPAANPLVAYYHKAERYAFRENLSHYGLDLDKPRDGLNCTFSAGNTNVLRRVVLRRQPNYIRASSRRVRRCARGTGRGRICLTRKDALRN